MGLTASRAEGLVARPPPCVLLLLLGVRGSFTDVFLRAAGSLPVPGGLPDRRLPSAILGGDVRLLGRKFWPEVWRVQACVQVRALRAGWSAWSPHLSTPSRKEKLLTSVSVHGYLCSLFKKLD